MPKQKPWPRSGALVLFVFCPKVCSLFWKTKKNGRSIDKSQLGSVQATWICCTSCSWSLTAVLSPPEEASPQVTTKPSFRRAAKALVVAWDHGSIFSGRTEAGEWQQLWNHESSIIEFLYGFCQKWKNVLQLVSSSGEIRPHRFGGEGLLIGVQTATLNAQSHFLI